MDSSPGAKASVMEVDAEPMNPQASVADTVGNLTYIEGDVLYVPSVSFEHVATSLEQSLTIHSRLSPSHT